MSSYATLAGGPNDSAKGNQWRRTRLLPTHYGAIPNRYTSSSMIRKLCNANQLPATGTLASFAANDGLQVCVARLEFGTLTAFENRCPHQNAPLSAGRLEGEQVVCPYHSWRFNTVTGQGEGLSDPGLTLYEIRQYGNEVFLRTEDKP